MKIASLTSLRFFAALGVFLIHYNQLYLQNTNTVIASLRPIFSEGYLWVGFFFILSGFIISFSHDSKPIPDNSVQFLKKRVARLYPVQLLMLAFFLLYFHGTWVAEQQKSILYSVFLIQSWIPDPHIFWGYNAVSWSISTEMFFYAVFLFAVRMKTKHLLILFSSLITILIFSHIFEFKGRDNMVWFYYINPASRFVDFAAGMLTYRAYCYVKDSHKAAMFNWTLLEVGSISLMAIFMGIAIVTQFTKSFRYDIYYIIPMSLVVFTFAFGSGWVSRMISHRFFVLLGEASFCMYMVHQTMISIISRALLNDTSSASLYSYLFLIPALLFIVVLTSIAIHLFYEKPMAKLITNNVLLKKKVILNKP